MTNHDPFRTLLSGADKPIAPDPLFARRLRNQFLAEIGDRPSVPENVVDFGPVRRNRMLDLAAVAILVLGVLGGLIGFRSNSIGLPTPTAQAADLVSPTATATQTVYATIPSATVTDP